MGLLDLLKIKLLSSAEPTKEFTLDEMTPDTYVEGQDQGDKRPEKLGKSNAS